MHLSAEKGSSTRKMAKAIFAWPPHPAVLTFFILARITLIINSIIGIGICFSTDIVAGYVAGSFHAVGTVISPVLLFWSVRQFRAALRHELETKKHGNAIYDNPRQPGLRVLQLAVSIDALGILGFIIVYPIFMGSIHSWSWQVMKDDYGSVTVLIPIPVHILLFSAELCQLALARASGKFKLVRCPHCSNTVNKASLETVQDYEAANGYHDVIASSSRGLLDEDEVTVTNGAPTQETGICTRTPRISESSQNQADANETGESENDRLISKSE